MANAMDKAMERIAQNKEFQQAREILKNNNVTIAANDNSQIRLAKADNLEGVKSVEKALLQTGPEAKMQQVIAEAKQNIPGDTMKDVKEISPPSQTPSDKVANPAGLETKQVDVGVQSNIEGAEKGKGNNYRNENAMDKFLAKQPKEQMKQTPQKEQVKTR